MADEEIAATEESATVTDAALDEAAGIPDEPVTEEEQPEEAAPAEEAVEEVPEAEPEPSALEKKLEEHEAQLRQMQNMLDGRLRNLSGDVRQQIEAALAKSKPEPDFEIPTSWPEQEQVLDQWYSKKQMQEQQKAQDYEKTYLGKVAELTPQDMPKEDIDGVQAELFTNFNVRHSDSGAIDAATNFANASRAYYSKKVAQPLKEVPVKGEKVTGPLGGATTQKASSAKAGPEVQLDEESLEFVRSVGMDEDEAKKILGKKMPAYLGG